jgi:hypothetical protein
MFRRGRSQHPGPLSGPTPVGQRRGLQPGQPGSDEQARSGYPRSPHTDAMPQPATLTLAYDEKIMGSTQNLQSQQVFVLIQYSFTVQT